MVSLLQFLYAAEYQLLALLVGIILFQQYMSWRRLSQFKGPFWASVTNLWMANSIAHRHAHLDLYEVSQKYGELARVGPNILLTSDPHLVERMSNVRSEYTKADWYAGQKFEVDHDNLISTVDERLHKNRRAQLAPGFSGKDISGLETTLDRHLMGLINLIKMRYIAMSPEMKPMDLARKISFFAMDLTCDLAFGEPWGCLERDEDVHKWFEMNETILPNAIMFSTIPWMAKFFSIPIIGRMVMPSETDATGCGRMLGIAKNIVDTRFAIKGHEQKRDMMGSFVRHGITKQEAVTEATLAIVAGTDTTSTVIKATFLYVITNPHVYRILQAAIDQRRHIIGFDRIISNEEVGSIRYLQAVINEGARLCPPAAGLLSKKSPPQGDTINGKFVPGGVDIGQCAWGLQRNKAVYGDDCMLFKPERWLEAQDDDLEKMEKSLGLVWGYGKYSCLGKNISWMIMNKVIFELFKRFNFTLIDPTNPWKSENIGLFMQSEMFVKVTERENIRSRPGSPVR